MNYKDEINKMKKHRKKYFPVMANLLNMHKKRTAYNFPIEIINKDDMLILLELLDIGYLEFSSFIIRKSFGVVEHVYYNGEYPLTEAGYKVFNQNEVI